MNWKIDSSWTLFLDRDGVINVRILNEYVKKCNEFILLPKAAEAIAEANLLFGKTLVVTNQQGIAKNLMTESNLFEIHAYCSQLLMEKNASIDAYYFAPTRESEQDVLRKPKPGMGLLAKKDFPVIDFQKSIMIGDSHSDIGFGKNLGMKTVFIETYDEVSNEADYSCKSLWEAIEWIKLTNKANEK